MRPVTFRVVNVLRVFVLRSARRRPQTALLRRARSPCTRPGSRSMMDRFGDWTTLQTRRSCRTWQKGELWAYVGRYRPDPWGQCCASVFREAVRVETRQVGDRAQRSTFGRIVVHTAQPTFSNMTVGSCCRNQFSRVGSAAWRCPCDLQNTM